MLKKMKLYLACLLAAAALTSGPAVYHAAAPEEEAVEASLLIPDGMYTGITKTDLNFRRAMSTSASAIIRVIPEGSVVVLVAREPNNWYRVTYKEETGYVKNAYLKENTDILLTTANLNLRKERSTSSQVLTTIPKGAKVEVVERNTQWKSWIKINYKGKTGYASSDYLKSEKQIKEDEEKAKNIDLADVLFFNMTIPYDGKAHSLPKVSGLPDGVTVSYNASGTRTEVGTYYVEATFKAEDSGKTLLNAAPRTAYLKISIEKDSVYEVNGLKYRITKANTTGYGTVAVKGPAKSSVKTVSIPDSVKIGGVRFSVTAIDKSAFRACSKLKTVTIGNQVKTIGTSAFSKCPKLASVEIGTAVKTMGNTVFFKDASLKKLTINSKKLKQVGIKVIKGINQKAVIDVPASKVKKYKKLLTGKGLGKKMTVK